ncbi:MAG: hypothetical protein A4E65_00228 [Syntrophorhabdus sp. PtaU1.Bin153]|nr:MAG: hypothetical protein A4E65_00228 [Syntrophorhabdus sp. PtaU1.Bin153]
MLKQYKTQTNVGVGAGIVAQVVGVSMLNSSSSDERAVLGVLVLLIGFVLFLWGCGCYAKAKGYSGFLGILGLLSLPGLVILACLSDRHKEGALSRKGPEKAVHDDLSALERLSALREKGVLTEEEFVQKKTELFR